MAEGDPIGEQIARELPRGRDELLFRWLAAHLRREPGGDHLYVTHSEVLDWLDTPIGEFCRGVSLLARVEKAQTAVAAIARQPRPWLTRLKLQAGFGTLVLDGALAAALPNLEELELIGAFDLRGFTHPAVRRLIRSVQSLEGGPELALAMDLPGVTRCVLHLHPWHKDWKLRRVTLAGLPALRELDLGPSDPNGWERNRKGFGAADVMGWLRELSIVGQLERLVVPAVRDKTAAKQLRAIAEANPQLAIHIEQNYSRYPLGETLVPRVTIAPRWPFPPEDETNDPWSYRVELPDGTSFDMFRSSLALLPRREFASRDEPFRERWRALWAVLDRVGRNGVEVPFGMIRRAIVACDTGSPLESTYDLYAAVVASGTRISDDQLVIIRVAPER